VVDYHFCATCGSTVYWDLTLSTGRREIGIAVGNFVDPDFPEPAVEYNTTLRHRWVSPVPAADQFDTIPTASARTPHSPSPRTALCNARLRWRAETRTQRCPGLRDARHRTHTHTMTATPSPARSKQCLTPSSCLIASR
jgi:hypothetical protein